MLNNTTALVPTDYHRVLSNHLPIVPVFPLHQSNPTSFHLLTPTAPPLILIDPSYHKPHSITPLPWNPLVSTQWPQVSTLDSPMTDPE